VLTRSAVIVKIDNAPDARPQVGLDRADLVIEEKVEGGITRFLVVFQSQEAPIVGPVRSVRSTDPDVVRAIGGLFAYSGGIGPFIQLLRSTGGVVDVGIDADPGAYQHRRDRPAPHNLYTGTPTLRQATPPGMGPPPAQFSYLPDGASFGGAGVAPVTHLRVAFGGLTVADWQWDLSAKKWQRSTNGTPHVVEGGGQLAFTTVVVQFVPYLRTPFLDPSRTPVDRANVIGSGPAWVLADGMVVKGTWTKPTPTDVTAFADSAGHPIAIPAGTTWVLLAPVDTPAQAS
jgi:hypothetical protein